MTARWPPRPLPAVTPPTNTLVWELDTDQDDTFAVHTGTQGLLVHNADPICRPAPGDKPRKIANTNMAHAARRAVERLDFDTVSEARETLQAVGKRIERDGFPAGTIPDTAHLDRILVPFKGGYAVYQIKPNGNAVLKTVLNARDDLE